MSLPSEWVTVPIGSAGKWYSGGTPSTGNPAYWNGEIPWISSGSLTNFRLTTSDRKVTAEGVKNGTRLVEPETILMVVRGMSLKSEFRIGMAMRPMTFGQDCKALVAGPSFDAKFLAYAILAQTPEILGIVDEAGHGTGRLNSDQLYAVEIGVPSIPEQQAIAEVLGALDDKIAANTKLIDTLEGHMSLELSATVARDSSCIALDDIADFHNRRRIPLSSRERDERPGSIPYYGASGVFGTVDVPIFDEPLVLVGEDGSVINGDGTPVVQYIWGPAWVNNHAHVLTGKSISTELLYYAIAREQVATLVTGAVQPKINMGNLKRLKLRIPSTSLLPRIESLIGSETAVKRAIVEEIQMLAATRDALLPQLMSGKLRVKEAEALVSAAV